VLDERLIRSLHVETLRHQDIHGTREPHVLFQASTIGALLEGSYDGEVTFAELAEHGDLGLGTLNGLDGEMIALDGRFFRADIDGAVTEIQGSARTPFAVVVPFSAALSEQASEPLAFTAILERLDEMVPAGASACAVRIDGDFSFVRARSVPRQFQPYRPLGEVIGDQHIFEFGGVSGSVVGFRFPDYAEGIEVSGYHLHFISADRSRGGHVLECNLEGGTLSIDPSSDLRIELPDGISLDAPELSASTHAAIDRVERG
jgi:acetolactate decarboxylase